jgi:imidazolonepropionase-like amidohydrolase
MSLFNAYVNGLEVLAELGFTNSQVIEAGTTLAAIGCGIQDKTGCLAKSKSAHIIAVQGNPLENINALRQIVMVMKSGTVVKTKHERLYGSRMSCYESIK